MALGVVAGGKEGRRPARGGLEQAPVAVTPVTFGRYEVEGILGEGSMGRVYRAFDPMAKRRVAIKTPRSEFLTEATAAEYLKRFRREAQAAAALSHPHIVTVFDVGSNYFVMELLEGITLHTLLSQRGRLEISEVLRVLVPIAEAIDYAHSKGTIHRDIKPANISLLRDGQPKIMDFGVAHLLSAAITAAGEFLGSPAYMAPEQISNCQASVRTDLFSLGVLAYQMLTGDKPFGGGSVAEVICQVLQTDPAPPSSRNPSLPTRYDDLFRRALAKDPGVRFPSATAFVATLGRRGTDAAPGKHTVEEPAEIETHDLKQAPKISPAPRSRGIGSSWRGWNGLPAMAAGVLALAGLGLAAARGTLPNSAPATAGLEIMTEPTNARVRLDGIDSGTSPLTLPGIKPGPHTVQVRLTGYAPAELSMEVPAGLLPVPLRFALQPLGGALTLRSEPSGAIAHVDGKAVGTTPIEGLALLPGRHDVVVAQKGFRPWSQMIEMDAGDVVPLLARLEPPRPEVSQAQLRALGWVRPGDLVELGPGVTPPHKISGEPPAYPDAAKRLRLQGTVAVALTVTEDGRTADIRVVESVGELLDLATLAAVRTWRYVPAERNGVKVRVRLTERKRFQLPG